MTDASPRAGAEALARGPAAPSGVWLGHLTPGTPEWASARSGLCITATEIAAVVGLSPWESRFSLWHRKAGLPTPARTTSPEMSWGSRLEPVVAQAWAEGYPGLWPVEAGTWRHRERDWQRATPDRLLYACAADPEWEGATAVGAEPAALLEVKTSPFGDGWEDGVPVYYRCQIQWQLDTLGLSTCHVALLVSGHDYREYVVEYDTDDAELLRREAEAFLASVEAGERPAIDSSTATYQTVRRQPEGREDVEVEVPAALADRYEAASAAKRAAEDEHRQAAAEVLDAVGDGRWAVSDGRRVAQRTVRDGRTHSLIPCKQKASTT